MNAFTPVRSATTHWRILTWALRAWHRMTWRHVLLAIVLQVVRDVFGPLGGVFFFPSGPPFDAVEGYFNGRWAIGGLSIVFFVLVADEAFNDGVPALRAYGLAVIALATFIPVVTWFVAGFAGWDRDKSPEMAWWAQAVLFQGSLGMSIYAYWRVTRRTMHRAQAAETERVRNEQRVQTARLLALQSRVEPQMLFDALGRVADLHIGEPVAADALLADLIALLRAMQPGGASDNSTLKREFALVHAWLRVTGSAARADATDNVQIAPTPRAIGIAPMLVLPMVRAVLGLPGAARIKWQLSAHAAGHRLTVTLQAMADARQAADVLSRADLTALRDRLAELFGRSGHCTILSQPPAVTLQVPHMHEEDPDDDRTDR